MGSDLDRARRDHETIRRVLLREWDPIGVAEIPQPQDEYDGSVGEIYGKFARREDRPSLIDHLWWIESMHMGLCGNRAHTETVADRLLARRDAIEAEG